MAEIRGISPKFPFDFSRTLINRAWKDIRRNNLWSFQLYDGPQWIAPTLITAGLATVTQGVSTVTVNATAAAAINAGATSYSPITKRQFRVAAGTIYNIWDWDGVSTLTLDRIYGESSQTLGSYAIFQNYYPAPYEDHWTWISIRNMQNFNDLFTNKTREQLDYMDPQRTQYFPPSDVVFYQQDQNPDSDTYRWALYEMWGIPTYSWNFQLYGIRKYPDLTADDDTLPPAIGEDCVIAQAKKYAYEWCEANKGTILRNQGPDFRFLLKETQDDYNRLLREYRRADRELVNNWFSIRRNQLAGFRLSYYNVFSSTAYPGASW